MPLGALLFLRPARDTLRMCEIEMLIFLVKKKEIGSTRMSLGERQGEPSSIQNHCLLSQLMVQIKRQWDLIQFQRLMFEPQLRPFCAFTLAILNRHLKTEKRYNAFL